MKTGMLLSKILLIKNCWKKFKDITEKPKLYNSYHQSNCFTKQITKFKDLG